MAYLDIPFGPYVPDLGGAPNPAMPGYLVDAVGVRMTPNGYRGMPQLQNVASSLVFPDTGLVGQAVAAPRSNGEVTFVVVADTTLNNPGLYVSNDYGQSWIDYSGGISGSFAWGSDLAIYDQRIFIPSGNAATMYFDLDDETLYTPASAPIAATGARVRDHMVLGALWDATDYRIEKTAVQWSAIGDPRTP